MKIFSAQLKGTTTVATGSNVSLTGSFSGSIAGIDINSTNTFTASTNSRLNSIETVSASNISRIGSLEIVSSSNISRIGSVESFTSSTSARLNSIETITASNVARINSIETITASNVARLNSLEIKTGSLATTGSNTFIGTQTITGSLYISSDLIVQGSSSLQNITASAVSIGTNIVNLNTANPAIRYAGLVIGDSGSIGSSGSFLYDSVQDEMIFVHRGANTTVTSSVVLMGPQTYDNIGTETYPTSNYIQKGTGNEHLVDSCIIDDGTTVCVNANLRGTTASFKVSTDRNLAIKYDTNINISAQNDTGAPESIRHYADTFRIYTSTTTVGLTERFAIANTGLATFCCSVTAKVGYYLKQSNGTTIASLEEFSGVQGGGLSLYNSSGTHNVLLNAGGDSFVKGGNLFIGTSTAAGAEKLTVTKDDGVGNGLHSIADFNKCLGSSAELILGYFANGTSVTGPVVYSSNGFPLLFSTGTVERMRINSGGCVGIGATSACSLLNVHCVSNGGDSLYTNMFTITTDVSSVYNHLAFSPTSIEYRREASTGVDLCIMTKITSGGSGGNIVFAPNLDGNSYCSYPRMKIQQNGFVGIGAFCAQTYLHICDNLSAGRDDLIRLQTNISTNHVWLKSISCAGVTSIFGSNRANTDGNLIANHAVAGTTSGHNFDLISNSTVRIRVSSGGAVCLLGNSNDYPSLFLAGPNYTMIAMGDRSSSSLTDVGYISVFNQGSRVIDLPGNADPITFSNGGPMIAGRVYANGDARFGYQFLEVCNGETYHGPLSLGNSGGGIALTPGYCGGGKRWSFGWNSGEMNSITNYNSNTPILINWGSNGDNPTTDRKFCFNFSGNAYASGGTWGTLSSNCIIKTDITAANSQWNEIKNICIVNYKMKEEIEEYGSDARIHLGVVVEQVAQVSPGLLEEGGYNCKWQTCLTGVKTSILHMKAVKALQEAMCRIEILESCLGIN